MSTGDNARFIRNWSEVSLSNITFRVLQMKNLFLFSKMVSYQLWRNLS